jgi:hypothetical protein
MSGSGSKAEILAANNCRPLFPNNRHEATAAARPFRERRPRGSAKQHRDQNALRHFAPASTHPSMMLSISARDSTPISATKTIRVRGIPAVGVPAGASVARPPAN